MDNRFIKSDKIDQKLRNALFKEYYRQQSGVYTNIQRRIKDTDNSQTNFETLYGSVFNPTKDHVVGCYLMESHNTLKNFSMMEKLNRELQSQYCYLLPNEIEKFCSEYHLNNISISPINEDNVSIIARPNE